MSIPTEWFMCKLSLGEAKAHLRKELGDHADNDHPQWIDLWYTVESKMLPGDEIYYFRSDDLSWRCLAGRSGYAIVRDGIVVSEHMTFIS